MSHRRKAMVSAVLSSADSQVKPSHPSSCCHRAGCSKYRALAVWKKCGSCRFGCTATKKILEEAAEREKAGTLFVPPLSEVPDNAIGYN